MSTTTTTTTPGMNYPTQKGLLAGNPRDSAIQQMQNTNKSQASLASAVGGKKFKNTKGGTTSESIIVPQFTPTYTSTGGPGTDPNSLIQQNSQTSTQQQANAVYDKHATITGGNKKYKTKKGGLNRNMSWGCYSGGKKHKISKKNKYNKIKTRKTRKTKKTRKTRK